MDIGNQCMYCVDWHIPEVYLFICLLKTISTKTISSLYFTKYANHYLSNGIYT